MSEEVTNLPDLSDSDLRACYPEVEAFAVRMRAELLANSGKGDQDGWRTMSLREAWGEIAWHNAKMASAIKAKDWPLVRELAADVANGAMMLDDLVRISLGEPQPMLRAVALERSTTETREQALNDATGAIINGGSYQDAMRAEAVGDQTAQAYYEGQHDAWAAVNELLLKDNLRPVVSDVAEDTPKPFVMRDLSSRASGLWPKESVDPARYGVTPTPEVSTGIDPVQFPPVPYPSTEES